MRQAAAAGPDPIVRHEPARRVRFATSMFFGFAATALCVLWVRSHWASDGFTGSLGKWYCEGFLEPGMAVLGAYPSGSSAAWNTDSAPVSKSESSHAGLQFGAFGVVAFIPLRFTLLTALALTVAPLVPLRRFSLRTLLIATTLVACVFGFAVWMVR